jgi:hypothetical protein
MFGWFEVGILFSYGNKEGVDETIVSESLVKLQNREGYN